MSQKSLAVEEKIIQAAIDCIEKYGIEGTTNRRIAEMAGVNGAAINYYFRSKEALIDKCMEITLNNAFDQNDFNELPPGSPHERYSKILHHLIKGGCDYPGLTRAHFHTFLSKGEFDPLVIEKINDYLTSVVNDLKQNGIDLDDDELALALVQSFASAFFITMAPRMFERSLGFDLNNETTRMRFIKRLVEKLL